MASGLESIALAVAHLERVKSGEAVEHYDRQIDPHRQTNNGNPPNTSGAAGDSSSATRLNTNDGNSVVRNSKPVRASDSSSPPLQSSYHHHHYHHPRFTPTNFPSVLPLGHNHAPARVVSIDTHQPSPTELVASCLSTNELYGDGASQQHRLPPRHAQLHTHEAFIATSPSHHYRGGYQQQQPSSFHHQQQQTMLGPPNASRHQFHQELLYRLPMIHSQQQQQQQQHGVPIFSGLVQRTPLIHQQNISAHSSVAGAVSGYHLCTPTGAHLKQHSYSHQQPSVPTPTGEKHVPENPLDSSPEEEIEQKQQIQNQRSLPSPSPVSPLPSAVRAFTDSLEDFLSMELDHSAYPPIPKPTEVIVQVQRHDVLLGRGGETNHHAGNIQYRQLVKICQPAYLLAKRRDKPKIAERIVHAVRCLSGRFLKKDPESSTWKDVGNTRAREKTSQALREGAPELRSGIPGGDDSASLPGMVDSPKRCVSDMLTTTQQQQPIQQDSSVVLLGSPRISYDCDHRVGVIIDTTSARHSNSPVFSMTTSTTGKSTGDLIMMDSSSARRSSSSSAAVTVETSPERSPRKKARVMKGPTAAIAIQKVENTADSSAANHMGHYDALQSSGADSVTATVSGDDEENVEGTTTLMTGTSTFSTPPQVDRASSFRDTSSDNRATTTNHHLCTSSIRERESTGRTALPRLKLLKKRFEQCD